jgi:D-glucosaminate-6-phosphate ammonia-lyase
MIYDDLGIKRVINANARWTALGGSIIKPQVLDAMAEAATSYVSIPELQKAAGRRIAELTQNEDAYVTVGAAAGVAVASLAAATRGDAHEVLRASERPTASGREVLIHAAHRFPFDRSVALAGLGLRTFGTVYGTTKADLEAAISDRAVAVLYVSGDHLKGALPLPQVVEIAETAVLPVIVDAAAQLPPKSNLWRYTKDEGAAAAIFSGGKELCGPQASGLIVGRSEFIEWCRVAGPPSPNLLRGLKTGKEEICGLVRAVELYIGADDAARIADLESTVRRWNEALGEVEGVATERVFPGIDGQPVPRSRVRLQGHALRASEVAQRLASGEPSISVAVDGNSLVLSPDTLESGEDEVVLQRILEIVR